MTNNTRQGKGRVAYISGKVAVQDPRVAAAYDRIAGVDDQTHRPSRLEYIIGEDNLQSLNE